MYTCLDFSLDGGKFNVLRLEIVYCSAKLFPVSVQRMNLLLLQLSLQRELRELRERGRTEWSDMQNREKWYNVLYSDADSLHCILVLSASRLFTSSRRVIPLLWQQHVYRKMYALYIWRMFRSMQKELGEALWRAAPLSQSRTYTRYSSNIHVNGKSWYRKRTHESFRVVVVQKFNKRTGVETFHAEEFFFFFFAKATYSYVSLKNIRIAHRPNAYISRRRIYRIYSRRAQTRAGCLA